MTYTNISLGEYHSYIRVISAYSLRVTNACCYTSVIYSAKKKLCEFYCLHSFSSKFVHNRYLFIIASQDVIKLQSNSEFQFGEEGMSL